MRAPRRLLSMAALLTIVLYAGVRTDAARPPDQTPAQASLAGRLLVATPDLDDPNFRQTVVYMIHHDEGGAMGLVLNRILGKGRLDKLLEGLGLDPHGEHELQIELHYGGPVKAGQVFMLHTPDYHLDETLVVSDFAALTVAPEVLEDIAAGHGPRRTMCALGYAGWGPHQLEDEITAGAWVVVEADEAMLFDDQPETKWQRAFDRRGIDL